jgi:hypothetical protein
MHGSRSKIPNKKISSGSVAKRDLIPAFKGLINTDGVKLVMDRVFFEGELVLYERSCANSNALE